MLTNELPNQASKATLKDNTLHNILIHKLRHCVVGHLPPCSWSSSSLLWIQGLYYLSILYIGNVFNSNGPSLLGLSLSLSHAYRLHPYLTLTLPSPHLYLTPSCCCCQSTPPCLLGGGGESVSVALWGFAASFSRQSSSRAATPEGSLHKSRADSVVRPYPLLISILLPICPTLPPSYPNFTPPPPHPHRALISPQSYPHFTPTLPHLTPTSPPPHPHLTPTSPTPHPHLTHTSPTSCPHLTSLPPHLTLTLPSPYPHLTLTLPPPHPSSPPSHPAYLHH